MMKLGIIFLIAQAFGNSVIDGYDAESDAPLDSMYLRSNGNCEPSRLRMREDYTLYPGIGYYKLHTRARTWNSARMACLFEGAHLAFINSRAGVLVLRQMFDSAVAQNRCNASSAFVGLHDYFGRGNWTTVTGVPLECTGYGEPIPAGSAANERCAGLTGGSFVPLDCNLEYPFFCKLGAS